MKNFVNLPRHLRDDIRQGMNPAEVLAVYCVRCESFVGSWKDLARREDFDEDTIECEDCLNEGGEEDE